MIGRSNRTAHISKLMRVLLRAANHYTGSIVKEKTSVPPLISHQSSITPRVPYDSFNFISFRMYQVMLSRHNGLVVVLGRVLRVQKQLVSHAAAQAGVPAAELHVFKEPEVNILLGNGLDAGAGWYNAIEYALSGNAPELPCNTTGTEYLPTALSPIFSILNATRGGFATPQRCHLVVLHLLLLQHLQVAH